MIINSTRFGELEVDEKQIFTFEGGIPGFFEEYEFAFIPQDNNTGDKPTFAYLQSLKTPELTFLLADPFAFFPHYEFTIGDELEQELGTSANNLPMVWVTTTILDTIENATVNLLGPLLFNTQNQKATQLILDINIYSTKHRIFENTEQTSKEGN